MYGHGVKMSVFLDNLPVCASTPLSPAGSDGTKSHRNHPRIYLQRVDPAPTPRVSSQIPGDIDLRNV